MPTKPVLKWAGGKRWLVAGYKEYFVEPENKYFEPFLGGGAVFFYLKPANAMLSDINADLIETYTVLRSNWKAVWDQLALHQLGHNKEYFYRVRSVVPENRIARAARFLYLNRTCFNGLYRVNRRGEFNVPIGTKSSILFDDDDFGEISRCLSRAELAVADFELTIDRAGKGDLIYADPPYTVQHNNNNFRKYNEVLFSWDDQVRLAAALRQADKRGAKVVLSNADHTCIRKLYKDFCVIRKISRFSILAGSSTSRRLTSELLITNVTN